MRPYNKSVFDLRYSYREIFHEPEYEEIDIEDSGIDSNKVYKVSYKINLLPQLGEHV